MSKYGFNDVLAGTALNSTCLGSRPKSSPVSAFLGVGIIITRRGAIHGLTTAAAVW
jgi:putative Mg2+ transporter-C (MgtC) family protein